jgi:hypothetical protein
MAQVTTDMWHSNTNNGCIVSKQESSDSCLYTSVQLLTPLRIFGWAHDCDQKDQIWSDLVFIFGTHKILILSRQRLRKGCMYANLPQSGCPC